MFAIYSQSATTERQVIERSGLSQATVSRLIKKLRDTGLIEVVEPLKRFGQLYRLTDAGRKQLFALERALDNSLSLEKRTLVPASVPSEEAQRAEPRAQISASEKVEPIYKAMQERDKERVDSFGSYGQGPR